MAGIDLNQFIDEADILSTDLISSEIISNTHNYFIVDNTVSISEFTEQDVSQADNTISLSMESSGVSAPTWMIESSRRENERLKQHLGKMKLALDIEREQAKSLKKDSHENMVRVRIEERDSARHKQNEIQLKLERQNNKQIKTTELKWQSDVIRLQEEIKQLKLESSKLKEHQRNLDTAKRRVEDDMKKTFLSHESELDTFRKSSSIDLRKQHSELREKDKELRDKKRELDFANERIMKLESRVDEFDNDLQRYRGGYSLEKSSPKAVLISSNASIGNRSFSDVTNPHASHLKDSTYSLDSCIITDSTLPFGPPPVLSNNETEKELLEKNAELSKLSRKLDTKSKKLFDENKQLSEKVQSSDISLAAMKDDHKRLTTRCNELVHAQRKLEERERKASTESKDVKSNISEMENQIEILKKELTISKNSVSKHKISHLQLEKSKTDLKEAQSQLAKYKEYVDNLEKDREDLKKRIDLLKHTKKKLIQDRDTAIDKSEKLLAESAKDIELDLETASKNSYLQSELDQSNFERDELRASISQLHMEFNTLQSSFSLLLELSKNSVEIIADSTDEMAIEKTESVVQLEEELQLFKDKIDELENTILLQEESNHIEIDRYQLEVCTLSSKCSDLTERMHSLTNQLLLSQEKIIELENLVKDSKESQINSEAMIFNLEKQLAEVEEQLKLENNALNAELTVLASEKHHLEENMNDKVNEISELVESLAIQTAIVENLQTQINEIQMKYENSEKISINSSNELNIAFEEQSQLKDKLQTTQNELSEAKLEKNRLRDQINDLNTQVEVLEMESKAEPDNSKELILLHQLEEAKNELQEALSERISLKLYIEELEQHLANGAEVKDQLTQMQNLYEKSSNENSSLQNKLNELESVKQLMNAKTDELFELRGREKELEDKVSSIERDRATRENDLLAAKTVLEQQIEQLLLAKVRSSYEHNVELQEAREKIRELQEIDYSTLSIDDISVHKQDTSSLSDATLPLTPQNQRGIILNRKIEELTEKLEQAQNELALERREKDEAMKENQIELVNVEQSLKDTELKLAEALQNALTFSREDNNYILSQSNSELQAQLITCIENAIECLKNDNIASGERHLSEVMNLINKLPGPTESYYINNKISLEYDIEKERLVKELFEIHESFASLEEELEETRSNCANYKQISAELEMKDKIITSLKSQIIELQHSIGKTDGKFILEEHFARTIQPHEVSCFTAFEPRLFVALFDYDPLSLCTSGHPETQLPIKAGDIVLVEGDMDSSAHYKATLGTTCGLVPANFVEELIISDPISRQRLRQQSLSASDRKIEDRKEEIQSSSNGTESTLSINMEESTQLAIQLEEIPLPEAPTCLTVEKVMQNSILITWKPPVIGSHGTSRGCYVIGYRITVNGDINKDVTGGHQSKSLLESLPHSVHLTISIATLAENNITSELCTIQHAPLSIAYSRPSTASSHFSLPISTVETNSTSSLEPAHTVIALFDYDPTMNSPNEHHEFELHFKEGDIIIVYGQIMEDGFYFADICGKKGLVPSNFVQEIDESNSQVIGAIQSTINTKNTDHIEFEKRISLTASQTIAAFESQFRALDKPIEMVAIYNYNPFTMSPNENPEFELAFKEGDVIAILSEVDKYGFYHGEINGKRGLIPSNFVTHQLNTFLNLNEKDQLPNITTILYEPLEEPYAFISMEQELISMEEEVSITAPIHEKSKKGVLHKGRDLVRKLGLRTSSKPPKA